MYRKVILIAISIVLKPLGVIVQALILFLFLVVCF